jgi:hypothetical protein
MTDYVIEQVIKFNYLGCQLGSNTNYDIQNEWQMFNYLRGTVKHTLRNTFQQETILKFYTTAFKQRFLTYVTVNDGF